MILEIWASAGAAALLIAAIAVFCGTLVQRLAGQGLGMVASPILAIVLPEYLPATVLLIGCVVGLSSSAMDFSTVEKKELPAGFAGRALGPSALPDCARQSTIRTSLSQAPPPD